MTSSPDSQPSEAGFFTAIRSWGITRGDNGFLGGVVDGLAQRVGMATGPARIIVVAAAIFLNGIVLLAYAAGWALLPDRRGNIIIQNFGRGVPNVGALIGIGVIALLGLGGIDNGLTYRIGDFPFDGGGPFRVIAIVFAILVPLAILAGVVGLVIVLAKRGSQAPGTTSAAPTYAAMPGQAPHQHASGAATGAPTAPEHAADAADNDSESSHGGQPATQETDEDPQAPVDTRASDASASTEPAAATSASAMASAHSYAYAPPVPPAPPRRPRVPGPGKGFYLAALAWIFLSAAGVAFAARNEELAVHGAVAWFVTFVAGLGILLVLVSLSGRKLGFLGFVGVMSVLPLLGIIASAEDIRESFARDESIITIDFAFEPEEAAEPDFDATAVFAEEFPLVVINGTCYEETLVPGYPASSARVSALDMNEDRTVDVTAEVTHVTVPEGTSITVRGEGDAQAHVVWPDRNITCDFYNAGGEHLRIAGPSHTLELVVYDDEFANTIVLTEVSP